MERTPEYSTKYYYSLNDLLGRIDPTSGPFNPAIDLGDICDELGITPLDSPSLETGLVADLWRGICNRYGSHYLPPLDHKLAEDEQKPFRDFFVSLIQFVYMTYPRYSNLTAVYQSVTDWMAKVESTATGTARFNDTPQNGGAFDDDEHTTNITQTSGSSLTDKDTPMMRIKELQDNFRDGMMEWVGLFDRFFIEEGNVI